ncbi:lysozyme inhibitor LprI family protein [uncultured Desulfobacter sp.]|uniref:lysozyme inhibitor LprI family protein n=1 Tax=uncultured Desulfobacter sp. TaxID=240139 RepID=UPI0029C7737E|nr:lysozyme inhibitor LprI family protein [uncultured Desulfobacter sp.]
MMTELKFIVVVISIFITAIIADAASFDCKKAGTLIEHTICNDEKLSELDEELARAYKNAKQYTDKEMLRKEQINWIKTKRAACKDVECLRNTYSQRIKELNAFGSVNTNAKQITFDGIIKVCGDPAGKGYCVDNGKEKKLIIYFFECDSYQNLCNKLSNIENNGTYSVTGKIDEYNYTFEKDVMIKKSTLNNDKQITDVDYKSFKLDMEKSDIPSQIKLVKGSKYNDFDQSYTYDDGNKNKILINGVEFEISFVIRGDNNRVKLIMYTAKHMENKNEQELRAIANSLTNKKLEKRTMNNYTNGKLATIILEHSEIIGGIEEDFSLIYNNENSNSFERNGIMIMIMHSLKEKKKSDSEQHKKIEKSLNDLFVTVPPKSFVCMSLSSYKQLLDNADRKINTIPSQCVYTDDSINFMRTEIKENYKGRTIVQLSGNGAKTCWVLEQFVNPYVPK